MSVVLPDDYGLASLKWTVTGISEFMVVTFGVFHPTAPPADWPVDINTALIASNLAKAASQFVGWTYGTCTVSYGTPSGPIVYEDTVSNPGSRAGESMAVNSCVLVRKNTGVGGRANRGRMFSPPINLSEAKVSKAGVIDPVDQAAIQADWSSFLTELNTAGYSMVILHSDPLLAPTIVNSLTVESIIATQRRRLHR